MFTLLFHLFLKTTLYLPCGEVHINEKEQRTYILFWLLTNQFQVEMGKEGYFRDEVIF